MFFVRMALLLQFLKKDTKISCAEKGRHGHDREVNGAEKCCKVSQAFTKDGLIKLSFLKQN